MNRKAPQLHVQGEGSFHVYAKCSLPAPAVRHAGAPKEVWLDIRSDADSNTLHYDVIWISKTATRLPEVGCFPWQAMSEPDFLMYWHVIGLCWVSVHAL